MFDLIRYILPGYIKTFPSVIKLNVNVSDVNNFSLDRHTAEFCSSLHALLMYNYYYINKYHAYWKLGDSTLVDI